MKQLADLWRGCGKWAVILILALAIAAFSGCGKAQETLDPAFDTETLKAAAQETVLLWNDKDFEAIEAQVQPELRDKLSSEVLSQSWDKTMTGTGLFKTMTDAKVSPSDGMAAVVLKASYENGSRQFTIVYTTNMEISGFWIK